MAEDQVRTGVSRRTVVKAAAWSVPVMAIGSQAPAMAMSPPVIVTFGEACKIPGASWGGQGYNKGYVFFATVTNTNVSPTVWLKPISAAVNGTDQQLVGVSIVTGGTCNTAVSSIAINQGQTLQIAIFTNGDTDSANSQFTFTYQLFTDAALTIPLQPVSEFSPSTADNSTPPWTTGGGSCPTPAGCTTPIPVPA